MTFDAREATAAAEAAYPPFEFIGLDGEAYHLPHPLMVDPALVRKVNAGTITTDEMLAQLSPGAAAAIEAMKPVVQQQLVKAWREAIDPEVAELGKELQQLSPTQTSAPPSKPSSRSVGKTSGASPSGGSAAA